MLCVIYIYNIYIYCLEPGGRKKTPNLEKQANNLKENSFSSNHLFGLLRVKTEYTYPVFSKVVILREEQLHWGGGGTGAKQPSLNASKWLNTFKHEVVLICTG